MPILASSAIASSGARAGLVDTAGSGSTLDPSEACARQDPGRPSPSPRSRHDAAEQPRLPAWMGDRMSEEPEDFATMFAREGARTVLEIGQVVKGRVILIGAEAVFVDVGGKGEAWIERAELADDEGKLRVAVGDEIEATVVSTGDEVQLSHKLRQGAHARQALAVAAQTGIPVEGKVAAVVKGGYEVTVGGLRAFCPFSQMELRRVETAEEYIGRVLEFRVTKYDSNGRNIVLSRRQLLEELGAKAAEETRKTIIPGAVLPGTVTAVMDLGAFV